MSDQPTREEIAKAMSRKPVEGCTPSPWHLRTVKTSCGRCHKILDEIRPDDGHSSVVCIYDDDTSLDKVSSDERAATAVLVTIAPELQAENQTLQALCRVQGEALTLMLELVDDAEPGDRQLIWETIQLMPTEGESG